MGKGIQKVMFFTVNLIIVSMHYLLGKQTIYRAKLATGRGFSTWDKQNYFCCLNLLRRAIRIILEIMMTLICYNGQTKLFSH